jgi:hypothetical protein
MGAGQDGNYNGQGTMMYPDGWKHIGEWKDNKRNGQGAFTFSDVELSVGYGKTTNLSRENRQRYMVC